MLKAPHALSTEELRSIALEMMSQVKKLTNAKRKEFNDLAENNRKEWLSKHLNSSRLVERIDLANLEMKLGDKAATHSKYAKRMLVRYLFIIS